MITKYSNPRYITSSKQLKNLLTKCKHCWKLTAKGSLITSIDSLPLISIEKLPQKKCFIILHVKNKNRLRSTGHWLSLAIYLTQRKCLIFDPANQIKGWENAMENIGKFCSKNKLKSIDFALKCQNEESFVCGEEVLAMCGKMHHSTLRQFFNLRSLLKKYDINSIEHKIVSFAEDHFRTKF